MHALPFAQLAEVFQRPDTKVGQTRISIWPTTRGTFGGGAQYTHDAEVPLDEGEILETLPNAEIRLDGERYLMVGIGRNDYLPHYALRLRRTEPML